MLISPRSPLSFAVFILLVSFNPNLTIDAKVTRSLLSWCEPIGSLQGTSHKCDTSNGVECCLTGKSYPQYKCSPPIMTTNQAILNLNCFEKGCDGGAESECDNKYHSNKEMIVALSTGWYNNGSRCGQMIKINANGKSVLAKVVDECDSFNGCDAEHGYQPPCKSNIVDASQAVWDALGLDSNAGSASVTWSIA